MNTTLDGLLDRRVTLEQPAEGYRVAVDTVLLAAAVPARMEEKALDLGCGVGGALLCLACRVPGIAATGIEIQDELVRLCEANIVRNTFHAGMNVLQGDLKHQASSDFDHVLMNPPYHDEVRHDVSDHAQKRAANTEKAGDLALWIAAAARALKISGLFTLIHRADRLEEIVRLLSPAFGAIEVLPIVPRAGAQPRRIILRARKGGEKGLTHCRDFVLHEPDGRYTAAAENVLRHMKALEFVG